jgi:hypothetical protein
MDEHSTLEDAIAFLNRIRAEAQRGAITLTPREFCAAVRLGAVEYIADSHGSIWGQAIAEHSAKISGSPVYVAV